MEIKQLETLRAIADTGSFRAAALQLRVTQSALTHRIKKFEEELGQVLVVRARPKVFPSLAGQSVLASAQRIFAEIGSLRDEFAPSRLGPPKGRLRVAASNLGIVYHYGHLCEEFIGRYPTVQLILTATETALDGVRQVIAGTIDAAFTPLPVDFPNLEAVTLGRTEHFIIVGRNHPLSRFRVVSLAQLKRFPFVRYQPSAGTRQVSDQVFLTVGGYPPILTESNDTEFIKRIVQMGLGVALVPAFTVTKEVRSGRLRALRIAGRRLVQEFGLVHLKGVRTRVLEVFKGLCAEKSARISTSLPQRVSASKRSARRTVGSG